MRPIGIERLLFIGIILFTSRDSYAAPLMSNASSYLDSAYAQPQEIVDGYEDKFYLSKELTSETVTVTYTTDDPILVVSATGAQITSLVSDATSTTLTLRQFSSSLIADTLYPVTLRLFTENRMSFAENEKGFKKAITGAYMSSPEAHVRSRPYISDEDENDGTKLKKLTITSSSSPSLSVDQDLSLFIPKAAQQYIGKKGKAVPVLRTSASNVYTASVPQNMTQSVSGLSVNVPLKLGSGTVYSNLTYVLDTRLIGPSGGEFSSGSTLPMVAHLQACGAVKRILLEGRVNKSGTKFAVKASAPVKKCVASFNVTPQSNMVYRFKFKGTHYQRALKVN